VTLREWIERQLAKRPERSEDWKAETRRRFGFRPATPEPEEDDAE